jgi:uncharacterized membrane protein
MTRARVRLFGYPFHPTLVVFPLALWPLALVADLVAVVTGEPFWWRFAFACLGLGFLVALASAATGMLDYPRVPPGRAKRLATLHLGLGSSLVATYAAVLALHGWDAFASTWPQWTAIGLNATAMLGLALQGFTGGRLVFTHHVGIEEEA